MSSKRLKSSIAAAAILIGLGLSATTAMACNKGCAPPAPPSPPSRPSGSHSHSTATATATATASATARSGASSTVIYGGGYSNWSQTPGTPQTMPLNVVVAEAAPTLVPAQVRIVETERTEKVVQKKVVKKAVKKRKVIKASCVTVAKVVKKPAPKPVKRVVVKKPVVQQQAATKTVIERTVVYESLGGQVINSGYATQSSYASSSYSAQSYQGASNLVFRATALQASCMDDQSNARGAAMTRPERELDAGYTGEVYRCASSERLVVSAAAFDGNQASFNGGRSLSCAKGHALWYERGGLFCRPAAVARQGHEIDLIQRYGTGIKVVSMAYVQSGSVSSNCNQCLNTGALTTMVFDGGVGGFVQ